MSTWTVPYRNANSSLAYFAFLGSEVRVVECIEIKS
jgi:hypothetical protein